VFEYLKIKLGSFKNDNEKECVLTMDEMAITPSSTLDASLKKYFGKLHPLSMKEMPLVFSCLCLA
jgi:hypothetical protein